MNRRDFIGLSIAGGALLSVLPSLTLCTPSSKRAGGNSNPKEMSADLVVAGGGIGGCAAALGALRNGLKVVMTEETDWIGGQITAQGVPLDEHPWIESFGSTQSYRNFRNRLREYYLRNFPLTDEARATQYLNPGNGSVSPLCVEPRVALAVLYEILYPYISSGKLTLMLNHKATAADVDGDRVKALKVVDTHSRDETILTAPYFVDATELGDLLPMTGTEFRTGAESRSETGELHAAEKADPANQQAFTVCFAMDYDKGGNHVIDKPADYDFWRNYVPALTPAWSGPLLSLTYSQPRTLKPAELGFHPEGIYAGGVLNLWNYRRIADKNNFTPGSYNGDITIVNWPQNDYLLGNLDGSEAEAAKHVEAAKQMNLSLFYWLQTEVPHFEGDGQGWPGLRLRGDIMGTADGMAKYPYVRESRRIDAAFQILEEHVGRENRMMVAGEEKAARFHDTVGVGYYYIDLHPTTKGNNYIDFASLPYQIPLGALIPQRMENLLPANKNIGTTHVTNGCYREHPTEWNIGETVGMLTSFAMSKNTTPRAVRQTAGLLADFQQMIRSQGVELSWPDDIKLP